MVQKSSSAASKKSIPAATKPHDEREASPGQRLDAAIAEEMANPKPAAAVRDRLSILEVVMAQPDVVRALLAAVAIDEEVDAFVYGGLTDCANDLDVIGHTVRHDDGAPADWVHKAMFHLANRVRAIAAVSNALDDARKVTP